MQNVKNVKVTQCSFVAVEIFGAIIANWLRVNGQIRLLVRQRKLTSCSRCKPHLFTITSHAAGKFLRRDKDVTHSGRGHVTPLVQ